MSERFTVPYRFRFMTLHMDMSFALLNAVEPVRAPVTLQEIDAAACRVRDLSPVPRSLTTILRGQGSDWDHVHALMRLLVSGENDPFEVVCLAGSFHPPTARHSTLGKRR